MDGYFRIPGNTVRPMASELRPKRMLMNMDNLKNLIAKDTVPSSFSSIIAEGI